VTRLDADNWRWTEITDRAGLAEFCEILLSNQAHIYDLANVDHEDRLRRERDVRFFIGYGPDGAKACFAMRHHRGCRPRMLQVGIAGTSFARIAQVVNPAAVRFVQGLEQEVGEKWDGYSVAPVKRSVGRIMVESIKRLSNVTIRETPVDDDETDVEYRFRMRA